MLFDWIVSGLTLWTWWLAGDDNWKAYIVGSLCQVAWIIYGAYILKSVAITTMAVILWGVLIRNMIKTYRRNKVSK